MGRQIAFQARMRHQTVCVTRVIRLEQAETLISGHGYAKEQEMQSTRKIIAARPGCGMPFAPPTIISVNRGDSKWGAISRVVLRLVGYAKDKVEDKMLFALNRNAADLHAAEDAL